MQTMSADNVCGRRLTMTATKGLSWRFIGAEFGICKEARLVLPEFNLAPRVDVFVPSVQAL